MKARLIEELLFQYPKAPATPGSGLDEHFNEGHAGEPGELTNAWRFKNAAQKASRGLADPDMRVLKKALHSLPQPLRILTTVPGNLQHTSAMSFSWSLCSNCCAKFTRTVHVGSAAIKQVDRPLPCHFIRNHCICLIIHGRQDPGFERP